MDDLLPLNWWMGGGFMHSVFVNKQLGHVYKNMGSAWNGLSNQWAYRSKPAKETVLNMPHSLQLKHSDLIMHESTNGVMKDVGLDLGSIGWGGGCSTGFRFLAWVFKQGN